MTAPEVNDPSRRPLRVWPGVVLAVLLPLMRFVVPVVNENWVIIGFFGAVACAAAIVLWWGFFSRASWIARVGAIVMMIVAVFVTRPFLYRPVPNGLV